MIRRPPRSTHCISSAASDVYKRQLFEPWGISSYLCGWDSDQYDFLTKFLMEHVVNFLGDSSNPDLVKGALEGVIVLARSHYGIYKFALTHFLVGHLKNFVREGDLSCALRTAEALHLIVLQQDLLKKEGSLDFNCTETITVCKDFFLLLSNCKDALKSYLEESRKPKAKQKAITPDNKNHAKEYAKLLKFLIFTINAVFYAYSDKLDLILHQYIEILQLYTNDISIIEAFAIDIQESIATIIYSFLAKSINPMTPKKLLNLALIVGLRNLYYASDYYVPVLLNYLRKREEFPVKANEKGGSLIVKSAESFDSVLAGSSLSGEVKDKRCMDEFLSYQQDSSLVTQLVVENVVCLFGLMESEAKAEVLVYLDKTIRIEMEMRSCPIKKQMLILSELISWVSSTNLARAVPSKPPVSKGELFAVDNGIVQIVHEGANNTIMVRNATYEIAHSIETSNKPEVVTGNLKDNYFLLKDLIDEPPKREETEVKINFEQMLKMLPVSLQAGTTNSSSLPKPIEPNEEITELIKNLDNLQTYNSHFITLLYILDNSNSALKSIGSVNRKEVYSDRFNRFIAELGVPVGEQGLGQECILEWRGLMSCAQFRVTAVELMQDGKVKSDGQADFDSVMAIWNESDKNCLEEIMKFSNADVYIMIEPLPTDFHSVSVTKKTKEARRPKKYGAVMSQTVLHDSFLARAVLRAAIVANMKIRTAASSLLQRCVVLDEISTKINAASS
eukprot:TRINITY_DN14795_c0_g1_i2.p1 TRINITY_DN14795_c0_g1~~TRINITY_DN14795_c0_g1_i2.p1  ORF type:complete len:739 (-),score=138.78 TRINITY_DN14795_c0_g1_i2:52-2247(-)